MIIKKCTFDELPDAMQMHIMYIRKIPVGEYRLAIWNEKDTLYYNNLKESEVKRFVTLIESEKDSWITGLRTAFITNTARRCTLKSETHAIFY